MDRPFGREDVLLVLAALAFLAGASLRFAQLASHNAGLAGAGKGTRVFFAVAAWVSSIGAILGWLLVLVEIAGGTVDTVQPWVVAVSFNLIAAPLGLMHARLRTGSEDHR